MVLYSGFVFGVHLLDGALALGPWQWQPYRGATCQGGSGRTKQTNATRAQAWSRTHLGHSTQSTHKDDHGIPVQAGRAHVQRLDGVPASPFRPQHLQPPCYRLFTIICSITSAGRTLKKAVRAQALCLSCTYAYMRFHGHPGRSMPCPTFFLPVCGTRASKPCVPACTRATASLTSLFAGNPVPVAGTATCGLLCPGTCSYALPCLLLGQGGEGRCGS